MKVILKQDVKNLGDKDELVTVRNGYGANYLIPKGMAVIATESNQKQLAETIKQRAFKLEKQKQEAQKLIDYFKDITVKIGAKAGENGKIFGSVTSIQIAEAVRKLGHEIDRKAVTLDEEHIKTLGSYSAKYKIMKDMIAEIKFEVIEE
ncbi:MAG: 50S ribosomal protein L9 [Bacteroidia bacterium]|nr:50S ribosomal protein L9 [Bacteroidia bacterium]MCZ2249744.1 50S ribosomal protein L9 [Bacteroidia bacterium]